MEVRRISPTELLALLNDPERSSEFAEVDKSQVYRWLKGQLPQPPMQRRIASALELDEPEALLRDPDNDWFRQFIRGRSREEIDRIRRVLEMSFPRTGTTG